MCSIVAEAPVLWCTAASPSPRRGALCVEDVPGASLLCVSAADGSGVQRSSSLTPRTPVLLVRCGGDHVARSSVVVFAAGGAVVAFSVAPGTPAATADFLQRCLRVRTAVIDWELPPSDWEGVTLAPSIELAPSDWMVSLVHRSSAAVQRAILSSAAATAAAAASVSAGVSALVPADRPSPLPQLQEPAAERVQQGLEAAQTSLRRLSGVGDHIDTAEGIVG